MLLILDTDFLPSWIEDPYSGFGGQKALYPGSGSAALSESKPKRFVSHMTTGTERTLPWGVKIRLSISSVTNPGCAVHPGSEFFPPRTRIQGPKAADPNPQQRMQVLRKSGKTLILDSLKYDLGVYLGSRFFSPWITDLDSGSWGLDLGSATLSENSNQNVLSVT